MYNFASSSTVQRPPYFSFKSFGNTKALSLAHIDNTRYPCGQPSATVQQQFPDPNVDNNTVNKNTLPVLEKNTSTMKSLPLVDQSSTDNENSLSEANAKLKKIQNAEDIQSNIAENFPTYRTNSKQEKKGSMPPSSSSPPPKNVKTMKKMNESVLLPVMDFRFNVREICKQIILLEDHLTHPSKRCMDCCVKHFLTIEAFSEELLTLDSMNTIPNHPTWKTLSTLPHHIRNLQYTFTYHIRNDSLTTDTIHFIVQDLRNIRKQYMIASFDIVFPEKDMKSVVSKQTTSQPSCASLSSVCSQGTCSLKF
uniref:Uncharacterized protein n=1 Tax=viral metagenome TaxID=1070528 RepID=A0A6C0D068_9ZZZZ